MIKDEQKIQIGTKKLNTQTIKNQQQTKNVVAILMRGKIVWQG